MKMAKVLFFCAAAALLAFPSFLQANTIQYGNFVGVTMKFLDVSETSMSSGDTAPLYGAPMLVGDSLVFTQMNFKSDALNGATDHTDGRLNATIESKNNAQFYIDRIRFQELGDVSLSGPGTAATSASCGFVLNVVVLEVDDSSLIFPEFIQATMTMSEGGNWDIATDGTFTGKPWNGSLTLNLTATLAARGITGHATKVAFAADNTLATTSEVNTRAYIAKKVSGLTVTPEIVPEPATIAFLIIGALAAAKKRSKKA